MLDVVAVTYGHTHELSVMINSMRVQTSDQWRLHVVHDGPAPELRRWLQQRDLLDDQTRFHETLRRMNDHGHSSRRWALRELCVNRQVLLTNADNYYMPCMVELVVSRTEDFVWWDCVHNYDTPVNHNQSSYGLMRSRLRHGYIDMGVAAIRTRLARQVGFKHTHETADWNYFEEVLATEPTTHKIDKIMMVHN